jgi:hypothetical protein
MLVLFDNGTPRTLARYLIDHHAVTEARARGWEELENGELVQAVKRNLKVDWTEPHRDAVRAEVRAAVRQVLRTRQVRREHFDFLIERIMEQAAALYADWPSAA